MANATPIILGASGMPVADMGAGGRGMPVEVVTAGNAIPATLAAGGIPIVNVGGGGGGSFTPPVFRSLNSTAYSTRTNSTVPVPAGVALNDIVIIQMVAGIAGSGIPVPAITPPAGFAAFGTETLVQDPSFFKAQMWCYWKRATASEPASYDFLHTACNTELVAYAYSGCKQAGVPLGATSNNVYSSGDTKISIGLGITTTQANSWLLFWSNNWTALVAASPPGMTERFDHLAYGADELRATAGATGDRVQNENGNNGAADRWTARMFELLGATV